jgi:hypothetical protein
VDSTASLHADLLLNKVLEACGRVGRDMVLRRLEGFGWDEIGEEFGISGHAARVRFSKRLLRADYPPTGEKAFGQSLPER